MALIAFPTTNFNSWASQAEATTYFGDRLNSTAWTDAATGTKDAALVTAFRQMEPFLEAHAITSVELAASAELLLDVKYAQCELALAMLQNAAAIAQGDAGSNIRRVAAGSASVEFFVPTKGGRFPTLVMGYLAKWLGSTVTAGFTFSNGGMCDPDDPQGFGLNQGYN